MSRTFARTYRIGLLAWISLPAIATAAGPGDLGQLISQAYDESLKIVGLCVFFMLVYAGLRMMFGHRDEAISIIKDAAIGTLLLFSAYVILHSINNDLVSQAGTNTLPLPGNFAPK